MTGEDVDSIRKWAAAECALERVERAQGRIMTDDPKCPDCGKLFEDCDAYLREEGVERGQNPDDYCQRGRAWERPALRIV